MPSMKPFILLFVLSAIFYSCGDASQETEVDLSTSRDTVRYGKQSFTFPPLSPNAKEQIENWPIYFDFYQEASSLHNLDLEELKVKTSLILEHTDSLVKKIPDTLYTNAIYSRINIIETRIQLLNQEIHKGISDKESIEDNIMEANQSVRNLILQLNEKFQKDNIDLQRIDNEKKELEKQKKFLDSVYKSELEDQQ